MDIKISVKVEPIEDQFNDSSINDEYMQSPGTQVVHQNGIKTEADLYENHQIKEEMVIGPTELRKQETDTSINSDTSQPTFTCDVCNKNFSTKNNWSLHQAHAHEDIYQPKCNEVKKTDDIPCFDAISCELCFKSFATLKSLKHHKKICPSKKVINETDVSKTRKKTHNRVHKCLSCSKTFTLLNNLNRHTRHFHGQFSGLRRYCCDKCDMKFVRKDYLIRHKQVKHEEGREVLYCECERRFFDKWSLRRHKKGYCVLKSATKPVVCDYCNKSFKNKFRLTEHIKRHMNKKYYTLICDICKKNFYRKYEIERHMLQHLGVSLHKYKCEICNKKFTRNWSLKKHLISHTGRKPFACKFCGRKFGSQWGCSSHEKLNCVFANNGE